MKLGDAAVRRWLMQFDAEQHAVMERFFLKMERVWQRDYADHAEAMRDIADYIVNSFTSARLHSTLGNLPPNAFKHQSAIGNRQSAIKQPISVCEII